MKILRLCKGMKEVSVEDVQGYDLITCLEYPFILSKDILSVPTKGCINAHYSLLPRYRGRHPIQWALWNGEPIIGVSVHYMDEGIDSGDVICQESFHIDYNSGYNSVYKRCKALAINMLGKVVSRINRGERIERVKQDEDKASYYPMRKPEDSAIDCIGTDIIEFTRKVNAMSWPMPNAFIETNTYKLYFEKVRLEWKKGKS